MRPLRAIFTLALCLESLAAGPYFATGIKIGEVTDSQAIVWARLTQSERRVGRDLVPTILYRDPVSGTLSDDDGRRTRAPVVQFPNGASVEELEGAAAGANGFVRLVYAEASAASEISTDWVPVDSERDYTHQFLLDGLKPGTKYRIRVEARENEDGPTTAAVDGGFKTAPRVDDASPVTFTVTTGQEYNDRDDPDGFRMYRAMLKLDPDFFVHTGDILYYDRLAKSLPLARWHWQRMYSLPTNVEFHRQVSSYFMKDDHDTWLNDCWPTMTTPFMGTFTFAQGQAVFREQTPMGEKTYRTVRWGKDLQIWMVEGRDFRSANDAEDGPDKTIWGPEQKEWFKRTVSESDAAFRVLISPTPVVGPDRDAKHDNHANARFKHEGDELRAFMAAQKNMVVICGDRHWQYVSVDAETGLREYSCGPASDAHAGGWEQTNVRPEHRYLNVCGGFLAVNVTREEALPVLYARHYSVDGMLLNEDRVESPRR